MRLFRDWPFYVSVVVLLLLVWLVLSISISHNHRYLVYALDDAYIHMAMAKNFSQSGVWGVTRYGFTPTSSSLVWTLLLSLTYYVGGVNEVAPLVWNLLFAVLVLAAAHHILSWYHTPPRLRLLTLLGIIVLLPLPLLILSGMEQTLQTLVSMLSVFLAARLASGESPGTARRDSVALPLLAPLLTSVRFEGMFLVAILCGVFVLCKRGRYALAFAACGFLPVLVNSGISMSHGWFWFPTSVLLKATLPDFHSPLGFMLSLLNPIYVCLRESLHVLVLLVSLLVVYIIASGKGSGPRESRQVMGAVLALAALVHLEFVGAAPLYRYDAWWCALAILFLGVQFSVVAPQGFLPRSRFAWLAPQTLARVFLVLLLFFPLAMKGGRLLWFTPQCTTDTFEQQYQMGLFVRRYYQNSTVALNDIGAVNFLADIHCLDLWGLANAEVAAARQNRTYQVSDIERLSKLSATRIAIVYDRWFTGGLPPGWIRVGRWTIPNNVNAGDDTVSFYAVNQTEAVYLGQSLTDFSSQLPADVIQRGR